MGTNTFHLLIVALEKGKMKELVRERIFVKLASEGIDCIGETPYKKGIETLLHYKEIVEQNEVDQIIALGTAALRTASNGPAFVKEAKSKTGFDIQIISGSQEANLIHQGVMKACTMEGKGLIMDIGGGSVEFIIADQNQMYWAQSFPIGVAVLFNNFHHNNPIPQSEIVGLNQHLFTILQPLIQQLKNHEVRSLIGASGTFDVVENYLGKNKQHPLFAEVPVKDFYPFYKKFIESTLEERLAMDQLPNSRAEMIIVALVLIHYVLQLADIDTILTSAYAMKEGKLYQMIQADLSTTNIVH